MVTGYTVVQILNDIVKHIQKWPLVPNIISDALLGSQVAVEGGHDECSKTSGFSRKRKRSPQEVTSPCEPGQSYNLFLQTFCVSLPRVLTRPALRWPTWYFVRWPTKYFERWPTALWRWETFLKKFNLSYLLMTLNLLYSIQKDPESDWGWGTCPSRLRCFEIISAILRSNLRFSIKWLVIIKVQVCHLSKYVVCHIESLIWYCL